MFKKSVQTPFKIKMQFNSIKLFARFVFLGWLFNFISNLLLFNQTDYVLLYTVFTHFVLPPLKYGMEQLAEYLDMRIRNEEKNIKENRDKLDRDYLYHFAWNGEELFKSHFMVKQYGELRQVIRVAEAPGEVHGYIQHKREECLKELVSGSIRRRSTDDIFNLAHIYRLECMQGLVKDYAGFERLLSMKAPQKEIRTKKAPERKRPDGLKM